MQPRDQQGRTGALLESLPRDAANDADAFAAPAGASGTTSATICAAAGWDPFEVWRTRVRDPRLSGAPDARPGAVAVEADLRSECDGYHGA